MTRELFVVEGLGGKRKLKGDIAVRGAKNAVLKIIPAVVLFEDTLKVEHVPAIEDTDRMLELLEAAGATMERSLDYATCTITPAKLWNSALEKTIAERLRASVVLTGPMLARMGSVSFPFPGGCVLGERSIDLFLSGFQMMGASVEEDDSFFTIRAPGGKLRGARIIFPLISVTGTETLMMAAVLAEGETVLENAAMEPEIAILAEFLNMCGASITGAGTPYIHIQGGSLLHAEGRVYRTPPDRIEAGSFAILAALAGSEVVVRDCEPSHMRVLLELLHKAGVPIEVGVDYVTVHGSAIKAGQLRSVSVRTHEYPGFPTDLQAPMAVFLTQTTGEANILETIFDGRFRYVADLVRMGADIIEMNPHRILIRGPRTLSCKELESPDLRGGLAYLIAATVAEGTSKIDNTYVIDRGYERIEERLLNIGLNIRRVKSN